MRVFLKNVLLFPVGIFIVILLVILLTVGVFWLVSLSPDEEPITLEYVPKFGEGSMIRYNMSDKNSVEKAIRKIDQLLERKLRTLAMKFIESYMTLQRTAIKMIKYTKDVTSIDHHQTEKLAMLI